MSNIPFWVIPKSPKKITRIETVLTLGFRYRYNFEKNGIGSKSLRFGHKVIELL